MSLMNLTPPVILAHHSVGDVDESDDPNRLVVSEKRLISQITWLRRLGYRFVTSADLVHLYPPGPRTAVLTFDDGWSDSLEVATPLLTRHGVRATFYICPGLLGGRHPDVGGPRGTLMSADDVRELARAGMEVGSHSMSHRDLRKLSDDELLDDLETSKRSIEDLTGSPCRTLAFPFGLYCPRESETAREAGYELALAWLPGPWTRWATPRLPGPPRHGGGRLLLKMWGIRRKVDLG